MKFLVIGHLCFDVVHPVEGPEVHSYGGIYYSLATLASLLGRNDVVVPVFGVNKADHQPLIEHLRKFPNVDTSGIYKFDGPTNRVHLYYKDQQTRIECSRDISEPIPYTKIRRHLSADGILVNMVSGSDITLETLDHIRMTVRSHKIPIHFDFHSLTLGVNKDHSRFRRPLENWRRWAFITDTVQLNEEEIAGLAVEKLSEKQAIGHMLTLSVKGVILTRGERGASLFCNDKKHVVRNDVEGIKVDGPLDTTGCGDVFGAAFLLDYVRSSDMLAAVRFANGIAASKTKLFGCEDLQSLKNSFATA